MFFVSDTIKKLSGEFHLITDDRRNILYKLSEFVERNRPAKLVFICTHNSRRSHISQIWAQTAAAYYNINDVESYSGGTEATAFNPRAVEALVRTGFRIESGSAITNPTYTVRFSDSHPPITVFSKKYNDPHNPSDGFAAVMTCTDADERCPVVTGCSVRISLPYDDPKDFDGTELESKKYEERVLEIGREILFAFSKVKRS